MGGAAFDWPASRNRKDQNEQALEPLVEAVAIDPRLHLGEPCLVAGNALRALGKTRRSTRPSASCRAMVVPRGPGEAGAPTATTTTPRAKRALDEAFRTWGQLPGVQRRKQLGLYLRAIALRVTAL